MKLVFSLQWSISGGISTLTVTPPETLDSIDHVKKISMKNCIAPNDPEVVCDHCGLGPALDFIIGLTRECNADIFIDVMLNNSVSSSTIHSTDVRLLDGTFTSIKNVAAAVRYIPSKRGHTRRRRKSESSLLSFLRKQTIAMNTGLYCATNDENVNPLTESKYKNEPQSRHRTSPLGLRQHNNAIN